jgi:predicted esterase
MSPFDTIKRVARTHFGFAGNFVKQHFNNEEEIVKFKGRLLVIHGQRDQIIDIRHCRNLVRVY